MVYKYGLDEGMEIIIHENVFFFIHICIEQSYRDDDYKIMTCVL